MAKADMPAEAIKKFCEAFSPDYFEATEEWTVEEGKSSWKVDKMKANN